MENSENQGIRVSGHQGDSKRIVSGFEKLWVWQRAHQLMLEVHGLCRNLPLEERFKRRDQIERSSSSVVDNMAEGYSGFYYNDKIKSFYIARKEAGETQNHIRSLEDKRYVSRFQATDLINRYEEVMRGINGYIRWLRTKRGSINKNQT